MYYTIWETPKTRKLIIIAYSTILFLVIYTPSSIIFMHNSSCFGKGDWFTPKNKNQNDQLSPRGRTLINKYYYTTHQITEMSVCCGLNGLVFNSSWIAPLRIAEFREWKFRFWLVSWGCSEEGSQGKMFLFWLHSSPPLHKILYAISKLTTNTTRLGYMGY